MKNPYTIIEQPIISEKAVDLQKQGKYTFRVQRDANKIEIREAVEAIYEVVVKDVNTMNVRGKVRRVGRGRAGRKPGWKKAIVTLAPGTRIEVLEGV